MSDSSKMLKWTSGGSLYKVEDAHQQGGASTISESAKMERAQVPNFLDNVQAMERVHTNGDREEQQRNRKAIDDTRARSVNTDPKLKKRKRDRSAPARPDERVTAERKDVNPRKGSFFNKFKKIFTRSSSRGRPNSKSAPNSPASSNRSFERLETNPTEAKSVDGRPPSSSSKVRRSRSRLERLIDAKREYRRHKEWLDDGQAKVTHAFSDVPDDGQHRSYQKEGERRYDYSNTADITLSFTERITSRKGSRDEKWKSISPVSTPQSREWPGLTYKYKNRGYDYKEATAKRLPANHNVSTRSDTCILSKRASMLERIHCFETSQARTNTSESEKNLKNDSRLNQSWAGDNIALLTKMGGLSPPRTGNDDKYLERWLAKMKLIDPLILCKVKNSLKKVNGGTKEDNMYIPVRDGKSLVDTHTNVVRSHSRGDQIFSPKATLKTHGIPILPLKTTSSDGEILHHSGKSVTINNNNGHKSVHARNDIDVLTLERYPKTTHDFVERSTSRTSFPMCFDKNEWLAHHSPFKEASFQNASQLSKVQTIVHTLEGKLSTQFNISPTMSSPKDSSSKSTQGSSMRSPPFHDKTGRESWTTMTSFSYERNAGEPSTIGQSRALNSHATSRSSESSRSKGFQPKEFNVAGYVKDTVMTKDWTRAGTDLLVKRPVVDVYKYGGEVACVENPGFQEIVCAPYYEKDVKVSDDDSVSSVSLIAQKPPSVNDEQDIEGMEIFDNTEDATDTAVFGATKINEDTLRFGYEIDATDTQNGEDGRCKHGDINYTLSIDEMRSGDGNAVFLEDSKCVDDVWSINENADDFETTEDNEDAQCLSGNSSRCWNTHTVDDTFHLLTLQDVEDASDMTDIQGGGDITKWNDFGDIKYAAVSQIIDYINQEKSGNMEKTPDLRYALITGNGHIKEETLDMAAKQNAEETQGTVHMQNIGNIQKKQDTSDVFESCQPVALSFCRDTETPSDITTFDIDWNNTSTESDTFFGQKDIWVSKDNIASRTLTSNIHYEDHNCDANSHENNEMAVKNFKLPSLKDEETDIDETRIDFDIISSTVKNKILEESQNSSNLQNDNSKNDTMATWTLHKRELKELSAIIVEANQNHEVASLSFSKTTGSGENREASEVKLNEELPNDVSKDENLTDKVLTTNNPSVAPLGQVMRRCDTPGDVGRNGTTCTFAGNPNIDGVLHAQHNDESVILSSTSTCSAISRSERVLCQANTTDSDNVKQKRIENRCKNHGWDLGGKSSYKLEGEVRTFDVFKTNSETFDAMHFTPTPTSNSLEDRAIMGLSFSSSDSPTHKENPTIGTTLSFSDSLNDDMSFSSKEAKKELDLRHLPAPSVEDVTLVNFETAVERTDDKEPQTFSQSTTKIILRDAPYHPTDEQPTTVNFGRYKKIKTREGVELSQREKMKIINEDEAGSGEGHTKNSDVSSRGTHLDVGVDKKPICFDVKTINLKPATCNNPNLWDDVTYDLSQACEGSRTVQNKKQSFHEPFSTEDANLTHTLHNQSMDSVTFRIVDYYKQLHADIESKARDDALEDATMDSVDFSFTASGLSDLSADGSGDRTKSRDERKIHDSQKKFLWPQAPPSAVAVNEGFLSESSSQVSLVTTRKEEKHLRHKHQRRLDMPLKRNLKRNRYVKVRVSEKSRKLNVRKSNSGHYEGKPCFYNEFQYEDKRPLDDLRQTGDAARSYSDKGKDEKQKENQITANESKESLKTEFDPQIGRTLPDLDLEYRPRQWFFLATMLFFQFLIHWLYAS